MDLQGKIKRIHAFQESWKTNRPWLEFCPANQTMTWSWCITRSWWGSVSSWRLLLSLVILSILAWLPVWMSHSAASPRHQLLLKKGLRCDRFFSFLKINNFNVIINFPHSDDCVKAEILNLGIHWCSRYQDRLWVWSSRNFSSSTRKCHHNKLIRTTWNILCFLEFEYFWTSLPGAMFFCYSVGNVVTRLAESYQWTRLGKIPRSRHSAPSKLQLPPPPPPTAKQYPNIYTARNIKYSLPFYISHVKTGRSISALYTGDFRDPLHVLPTWKACTFLKITLVRTMVLGSKLSTYYKYTGFCGMIVIKYGLWMDTAVQTCQSIRQAKSECIIQAEYLCTGRPKCVSMASTKHPVGKYLLHLKELQEASDEEVIQNTEDLLSVRHKPSGRKEETKRNTSNLKRDCGVQDKYSKLWI